MKATSVDLGRKLCVKRPAKGFGVFGLIFGGLFLAGGVVLAGGGEPGLGAFSLFVGLFLVWAGLWTITTRTCRPCGSGSPRA